MQLWPFRHRQEQTSEPEDVLEQHVELLLAGDVARARALREQQPPQLAALLSLAEQLALAYRPVSMSESTFRWLREVVLSGGAPVRRLRIAAAVRDHGKEAMLGAALVGTAVSLGRVAVYWHRKRQGETLAGAGLN